jgi:16S rRNA (adenine(1408)-N(1))-methyltransferase
VIDIGTGDGHFVYQSARRNPTRFYIGIDANARPLEKISEKIYRKPSKGGLSNLLFIQGALEDLPDELNGLADEVHVHFPWGSLLGGVATGDETALRNLRRICSSAALLEVVIGFDPERDKAEFERLKIPVLSIAYVDSVLLAKYERAGFYIVERDIIPKSEWSNIQTSWAKRLKGTANRLVLYLIASARSGI